MNSTPLNSTPGDQATTTNEASREALDQLASAFRPSWELDDAAFSGGSGLSPAEIQALGAGALAPELRGQTHASVRPLPPPKPTELAEPTQSVIVEPASAGSFVDASSMLNERAAQRPPPASPGEPFLPERLGAMSGPLPPADPLPSFPETRALGEPAAALEGAARAPQSVRPPGAQVAEVPTRSPSVRPPAGAAGETARTASVRPGAPYVESPERGPWPQASAGAPNAQAAPGWHSWRPPAPSADLGLPASVPGSSTGLWIGVGVVAAALICGAVWLFGAGTTPPASGATAPAASTVEAPAAAAAPAKVEPAVEPSRLPPQSNALAAPPPALPAAEPPPPPPQALPALAPLPPMPVAARPPAARPASAPTPKPAVHPKAATIVRDVPF